MLAGHCESSSRPFRQEGPAGGKAALDAWFDEVSKASWKSTAEVKRHYATASVISAERIVFDIKGSDYRLVVEVDPSDMRVASIKWIGTHNAYAKDRCKRKIAIMVTERKRLRSKADYQNPCGIRAPPGRQAGPPNGDRLDHWPP